MVKIVTRWKKLTQVRQTPESSASASEDTSIEGVFEIQGVAERLKHLYSDGRARRCRRVQRATGLRQEVQAVRAREGKAVADVPSAQPR